MSVKSKKQDVSLPQAVDDCHKVLVWLVPMLDQFPKSRRYTLGSKMENELLEVLEALLNATYSSSSQRKGALQRANRKLAVVRHLLRLAMELRICSPVMAVAFAVDRTLMVKAVNGEPQGVQ